MGQIVFAAAMSHAPGITAFPDAPAQGQKKTFYAAMEEAGQALRNSKPDVLIVVSSDHFTNLSPSSMPAFTVGTAEKYRGPVENWIKLNQVTVPGAPDYAKALVLGAYSNGFEPTFADELRLEHGVAVPLHFLAPALDVPIVPVLQNCMLPPLPTLRRCYDLGRVFAKVVNDRKERVAIVGTGGLSHAPGAPEAGQIDEAFDRRFLALLEEGRGESAAQISDAEVDAAGFGAWEIRQWITVAGAVHGQPARVIAYEAVKEWDTGCGVVIFKQPVN